jgi:hypothetical protein
LSSNEFILIPFNFQIMKNLALLLFGFMLVNTLVAQTLSGGWKHQGDTTTTIWIIAEGYYMKTTFTTAGNRFVSASGGLLTQLSESIQLEVEYNSARKEDVGNYHLYDFSLQGNTLTTKHHDDEQKWVLIDDGKPGALSGAWLFSGRRQKPEEEIQPYTPGVRKTMKIMSGTRFQWAAYNTETKEFFGTGGGTYTTQGDKYTENIDVFSRDNSRVGASLIFSMKLEEPNWYHTGKSSKGDIIYERWSRRRSFADQ